VEDLYTLTKPQVDSAAEQLVDGENKPTVTINGAVVVVGADTVKSESLDAVYARATEIHNERKGTSSATADETDLRDDKRFQQHGGSSVVTEEDESGDEDDEERGDGFRRVGSLTKDDEMTMFNLRNVRPNLKINNRAPNGVSIAPEGHYTGGHPDHPDQPQSVGVRVRLIHDFAATITLWRKDDGDTTYLEATLNSGI